MGIFGGSYRARVSPQREDEGHSARTCACGTLRCACFHPGRLNPKGAKRVLDAQGGVEPGTTAGQRFCRERILTVPEGKNLDKCH